MVIEGQRPGNVLAVNSEADIRIKIYARGATLFVKTNDVRMNGVAFENEDTVGSKYRRETARLPREFPN
jgi:hypothetical protein